MPGPRRATRARRPPRSRREIEAERFAPKPLTPREVMRKRVIQVGVGILLVAFLFTSGIMCVNMGQTGPEPEQQQTEQSQLDYWKEQLAKDPASTEAIANVGHFLIVEAAAKPKGPEQDKLLEEARVNLTRVSAMPSDPNRAFALQELAKLQMFREDWAGAQGTLDEALQHAERPLPEGGDATSVQEARNSEKAAVMMLLAQLQAQQQKYAESLATLDRLAELNPPNAMDILFMRASLYEELGEKQKALAQLDIAEKFASTPEEQMMVMFRKQALLAPPPSASPSPAGSPEVVPSPLPASSPSPAAVSSPSPAPVASPSPSPAAVRSPSPAPVRVASPSPAASPSP